MSPPKPEATISLEKYVDLVQEAVTSLATKMDCLAEKVDDLSSKLIGVTHQSSLKTTMFGLLGSAIPVAIMILIWGIEKYGGK